MACLFCSHNIICFGGFSLFIFIIVFFFRFFFFLSFVSLQRERAKKVLHQAKPNGTRRNETKWNNAYESWINKLKSRITSVYLCIRNALIRLIRWEPILSHLALFNVDICAYFVAVLQLVHVSLFSISIKEYCALWGHLFSILLNLIASQMWNCSAQLCQRGNTWAIRLK